MSAPRGGAGSGSRAGDGGADAAPVGVGVLGLGFMGGQHIASYAAAAEAGVPNRLVAVCDTSAAARSGDASDAGNIEDVREREPRFDPETTRVYATREELFADPDVELVSICTYTDAHVRHAMEALAAGKHVLVEKPVALTSAAARELADAADRAWSERRLLCMPAMCMRFWPGWDWLAAQIRSGDLGAVRRAHFARRAPAPSWARDFYGDADRCGDALLDLHVHDADFVRWCFGAPAAVTTTGTPRTVATRYDYGDDGPEVTVDGAWIAPDGRFEMMFVVELEGAVADYVFTRDPQLRLVRGDAMQRVDLADGTGYDGEIRAVLRAVSSIRGDTQQAPPLAVTARDAVDVLVLLEAERQSLERGVAVAL